LDPAWSPDGRYIAFESDRNGEYDIYVIDVDGTNAIQLTDNPGSDTSPVWAPAP